MAFANYYTLMISDGLRIVLIYFQDVLQNEDLDLDNMFISSLVADLIKVHYLWIFEALLLFIGC